MNLKISDSEMGSDATQERGGFPATSRDTLATVVEDGAEATALAYVEALDGAERKLLLGTVAQAWPDVVRAGAELLAARRAETADRARHERVTANGGSLAARRARPGMVDAWHGRPSRPQRYL